MAPGRLDLWVRQTRGFIAELADEERALREQREQLEQALAAVESRHRAAGMTVRVNGSGVVDGVARSPKTAGGVRYVRRDARFGRRVLLAMLDYGEPITVEEAVSLAMRDGDGSAERSALRSALQRIVAQGHHARWCPDGERVALAPGVTRETIMHTAPEEPLADDAGAVRPA